MNIAQVYGKVNAFATRIVILTFYNDDEALLDAIALERKVEERPQSLREACEGSGAANGRQGLQTLYNAFDSTSPI